MSWESIIALIISGTGLIISVIALIQAKKANKEVLKQNIKQELAQIDTALANTDVEIERVTNEGKQSMSSLYGLPDSNPRQKEIDTLNVKKRTLLKRKQELQQQL